MGRAGTAGKTLMLHTTCSSAGGVGQAAGIISVICTVCGTTTTSTTTICSSILVVGAIRAAGIAEWPCGAALSTPATQQIRQTDRKTGRQAGRQTCRQTDRQTDRQTHRHTVRQTDTQSDGQMDTQSSIVLLATDLPVPQVHFKPDWLRSAAQMLCC